MINYLDSNNDHGYNKLITKLGMILFY